MWGSWTTCPLYWTPTTPETGRAWLNLTSTYPTTRSGKSGTVMHVLYSHNQVRPHILILSVNRDIDSALIFHVNKQIVLHFSTHINNFQVSYLKLTCLLFRHKTKDHFKEAILPFLSSHGYRLFHMTHYFYELPSRRIDVIECIQRYHPVCPSCEEIYSCIKS